MRGCFSLKEPRRPARAGCARIQPAGADPDLPLANPLNHAKSASIMLTGIIIALLFLGAGVIVFTYLKKGAM